MALKIIKHCKESLPNIVTGVLLGLDVGTTLEVTNCFLFPSESEEDDENKEVDEVDGDSYQLDMMRCLRDVNADSNIIGWYQSTYLGSFLSESVIENQFEYQENLGKCVCIVYDPLRSAIGNLALRAFRLTSAFIAFYKRGDFTEAKLLQAGVRFQDILEEVPIRVHNSELSKAFLYDLDAERSLADPSRTEFDALELASGPMLEKSLEFLIETVDELSAEQLKFQNFQRSLQKQYSQQNQHLQKRKLENQNRKLNGLEELDIEEEIKQHPLWKPIAPPQRLESLLMANQINNYCEQLNDLAIQSFSKLYLVDAIRDGQDVHNE